MDCGMGAVYCEPGLKPCGSQNAPRATDFVRADTRFDVEGTGTSYVGTRGNGDEAETKGTSE